MTFPNQHLTKTHIIERFQSKPLWTAAELHGHLSQHHPCTLQAVYKELRALSRENIVRKIGKNYTLNASWIIHMQAFMHRVTNTCFSQEAGIASLALNKRKQSWKFESLMDMNDFWAHLFVHLAKHSPDKNLFLWNPYLWWWIFQTDMEDQFTKSVRMMGRQMYTIIGRDCFLNRWGERYLDKNGLVRSFAKGPFHNQMNQNYNVLGNHIITATLAPHTHTRIEKLFHETRSMEDLLLSDIMSLFSREGDCTLTLENNPEKAQRMRSQFIRFFGIEV